MRFKFYKLKSLNVISFLMLIALFISKLTGQLRVILIGQRLGFDTHYADAFSQAFLLPDLIFALLIGGSIQAAIVPYLSQGLANQEEEKTWHTLSSFMTILAVLMGIFLFFSTWQAPFIMKFFTTQESYEASVIVSRALMPQAFFMMLAGFLVGILNSYRYFVISALLPSLYNLLVCLSVVLFAKQEINALLRTGYAITFVSGLYFLLQLAVANKRVRHYRLRFAVFDAEVQNLFKVAFPTLLASAIPMLSTFVISSYYHLFSNGTAYAYSNATSVGLLPFGIFVVAIGNVLLPHLSTSIVEEQGRLLYSDALKKVGLTIIPSIFILVVYRLDVVRTIFQWGSISTESLRQTTDLLPYYALVLFFFSFNYLFNLVFYAQRKTYLSLLASFVNLLVLILLSYIFVVVLDFGYQGMAVAMIISHATQSIFLLYLIYKYSPHLLPTVSFQKILSYSVVIFITSILGYLQYSFAQLLPNKKILQIAVLFGRFLFVFACFFILHAIFDILPKDMSRLSMKNIFNKLFQKNRGNLS